MYLNKLIKHEFNRYDMGMEVARDTRRNGQADTLFVGYRDNVVMIFKQVCEWICHEGD